jgi:DNA-binding NarL/FixJ family response regulator
MSKEISLQDIHEQLEISNRLVILGLVREGVPQKDIATTIGISEGTLSKMFSKGVLKRVAFLSKLKIKDSSL